MYITVERTENGFRWNAEDRGEWEAVLRAVDAEARKIDEVAWQAACDQGYAPNAPLSADGWRYCYRHRKMDKIFAEALSRVSCMSETEFRELLNDILDNDPSLRMTVDAVCDDIAIEHSEHAAEMFAQCMTLPSYCQGRIASLENFTKLYADMMYYRNALRDEAAASRAAEVRQLPTDTTETIIPMPSIVGDDGRLLPPACL